MHEQDGGDWYTPATAAMGARIIGRRLRVPDDLAAIGEQYSPTKVARYDWTREVEPHFKVVRLGNLGELLGKGTRYILQVSFEQQDLIAVHAPGHSDSASRFTEFEAPCVRALRLLRSFDLTQFDDLLALTSADWRRANGFFHGAGPYVLGSAVLALGAYEVYLQACTAMPQTFSAAYLLTAIARAGDSRVLADWFRRVPPDLDTLGIILNLRTSPNNTPVLAPTYAPVWAPVMAPSIAHTVMDALLSLPPRPGDTRFGETILETLADVHGWERVPAIAARFADRAVLSAFLARHWGRGWPAFDAASAMQILITCYGETVPDELWRAITAGGDPEFTSHVLERCPPDEAQHLRIVADALYQGADALLPVLDPDRSRRAHLAQAWREETRQAARHDASREDPGSALRAYVQAMEQGDVERVQALEAEGVDGSAYHEVGLRIARRRGHAALELHLLGMLTRRQGHGRTSD